MAARISLLLPTWRRLGSLRETLASVWGTVARPELLEVILYVQDGDDETPQAVANGELRVTSVLSGPYLGYKGLPIGINRMAEACTGDWLFVFADDVTCGKHGWDEVIRSYPHTIPFLLTCANNAANAIWFPVISRPAYEALGRVTASQFHDVWLGEIFDRALPENIRRAIPAFFHDHIVCPQSIQGLPAAEFCAFRASVEDGVGRLRATREAM